MLKGKAIHPQVGHCDTDNAAKSNMGKNLKTFQWTNFLQGAQLLVDGHATKVYNTIGTPEHPTIGDLITIWKTQENAPPSFLEGVLRTNKLVAELMIEWGPLIYASQKRRSKSVWVDKFSLVMMNGCIPHGGLGSYVS